MPLVVPGLMSNDNNKTDNSVEDWMSKLSGKKLGEDHNETTFAKQDLPKEHRVMKPDSMSTMDHKPERLNIHIDEEGTIKNVRYG